jgi:hypothetical protein
MLGDLAESSGVGAGPDLLPNSGALRVQLSNVFERCSCSSNRQTNVSIDSDLVIFRRRGTFIDAFIERLWNEFFPEDLSF